MGALPEEDEFNAMETQQFLSEFRSGIGDSVLALEHVDLLCVRKGRRERLGIQRPGVNVRVDAESGRRTIEEGFRLLPVRTGLEEGLADGVDLALGQGRHAFLRSGGEGVVQIFRLVCQVFVRGIHHTGNIILHDGFHLQLGSAQPEGIRLVVFFAGDQAQAQRQHGHCLDNLPHNRMCLILIFGKMPYIRCPG